MGGVSSASVRQLRRWEDSGGIWRVVSRGAGRVELSLLSCDAGEEMDRLVSTEADMLAFVGDRSASDEKGVPLEDLPKPAAPG